MGNVFLKFGVRYIVVIVSFYFLENIVRKLMYVFINYVKIMVVVLIKEENGISKDMNVFVIYYL